MIDGEFISQEDAFQKIYYQSYVEYFEAHSRDLQELIRTAKKLRNPHAEATTGVDLQIPAILQYLETVGLSLQGSEVMDIGSWQRQASHPLSIRVTGNPGQTLELILAREKMPRGLARPR